MLYALLIVVIAGAIFEIGIESRRRIFRARAREVLKAHLQSGHQAAPCTLSGLPDPVAHYLNSALPEDLPLIKTVRLRHEGFFRTGLDKKWEKIKGEQYFSGIQPGFVWKGATRLFTAIDSYVSGKGNLSVWLFSVIRIVNKRGNDIDDAEIIRWLAESALVPSNLLPSERLQWEAIDGATARLKFSANGKVFSFMVRFNTHNEIEEVETERPFNDKSIQRWKGRFRNYKKIEGFRVPTELEAIWIINGVEKPYARFRITKIDFNCAEMF